MFSYATKHILTSILHIEKSVVDDIDKLDFLCNKGYLLIAQETLTQSIDLSGLKMISALHVFKTAKIIWIKRLTNSTSAR